MQPYSLGVHRALRHRQFLLRRVCAGLALPLVPVTVSGAGALITGNGVVQWYLGASGIVVTELLVTGLVVIVATSITFRK